MVEGILAAWSAIMVGSIALIWWRMEKNAILLRHEIERAKHDLQRAGGLDPQPIIDQVVDEVQNTIEGVISQMRTPQLADHLGAILSQWAQIKMAKEMQKFNGTDLIEAVSPETID